MSSPRIMEPYHTVRARAVELYPHVFTPRRTPPVPLQVGIDKQMSALRDEVGEQPFGMFMRVWTLRREYMLASSVEGPRYGLDGKPNGVVTALQAQHARQRMSLQKVRPRQVPYSQLKPKERAKRELQSALDKARQASPEEQAKRELQSALDKAKQAMVKAAKEAAKAGLSAEERARRELQSRTDKARAAQGRAAQALAASPDPA